MSDSEEESNLPTAAECQKAIDLFVQVTSTDEALAQSFLQVKIGLSLPHGQGWWLKGLDLDYRTLDHDFKSHRGSGFTSSCSLPNSRSFGVHLMSN